MLDQLRLGEQRVQIETLDGVGLHHLNDRGRKKLSDVTEPPGHRRRRLAEPASPVAGAVVQGAERAVHGEVVAAERGQLLGSRVAENQAPAPHALWLVCHGNPKMPATTATAGAASSASNTVVAERFDG